MDILADEYWLSWLELSCLATQNPNPNPKDLGTVLPTTSVRLPVPDRDSDPKSTFHAHNSHYR